MNKEISFLIQNYFGEIDDPYIAAIDKAYFDMQTHMVSGENDLVFDMRFRESEYLYERLINIKQEDNYDICMKTRLIK